MDLHTAETLYIEHPGGFRRALARVRYRVDVYDEHGDLLAEVSERRAPRGPLKPVRATGFSGHTPFHLRVTRPDGRQVLGIAKRASWRSPLVRVTGPDGASLGALRRAGSFEIELSDRDGRAVGTLSDFGLLQVGDLARRDGRRVRRDVLQVRPGVTAPARHLLVAAAVAFDIVHNLGTTKPSGWSWPAG